MSSKPAGGKPLKIGDVIEALETKVNDKGVLRVRVAQGWVSETAGDGTVLLEELEASTEVSNRPATGSLQTHTRTHSHRFAAFHRRRKSKNRRRKQK